GGSGSYTYDWSEGSSGTDSITNLATGDYSVTVDDINNCNPVTASATITRPANFSVDIVKSDNTCNGDNLGEITATASDGTGPYAFEWSTGDSINDPSASTISNLVAGEYSLSVTDDGSPCDAQTFNITITEPDALDANESVSQISCNGADDGSITLNPSGGDGTYVYEWADGPTSASRTGLAPGTYQVTVRDEVCETVELSIDITEPLPLETSATVSQITCYGADNGSITVGATGSDGTYTFTWADGPSGKIRTNLAPATYTVTVADGVCETKVLDFDIVEPDALAATLDLTHVSCNGANDGSITVNATGSDGDYTFTWADGPTGATRTNLAPGTYRVTVDDEVCGTEILSGTITEPDALAASYDATNVSCNGANDGSITVNASGSDGTYTYTWADGPTGAARSNLAPGTYTVTVDDEACETIVLNIDITEPDPIVVSETITPASCNGAANGGISLAVTGGSESYAYTWSPDVSTSNEATGLAAGDYDVTVDDGSCTPLTFTYTVTEPDPIVVSETITPASCNGAANGGISLAVTGGSESYAYTWSPDVSTSNEATGLAAGDYDVTVDDGSCTPLTFTYTVTEPDPIVVAETITPASCNGTADGNISLEVTGGPTGTYTYAWSPDVSTSHIASDLTAGTYKVTVSDGTCSQAFSYDVTEPDAFIVETLAEPVSCNGGSDGIITLDVTGGSGTYEYAWEHGATSQNVMGLSAGTYTVTVSDGSCPDIIENIDITEPEAINITESIEPVSCNGEANGSITLAVTGGSENYTFTWNPDVSTSEKATGLAAGGYDVTVDDDNCEPLTRSYTVDEPEAMQITAVDTSNITEIGADDGLIELTVAGGTTPYYFSLSGGSEQTENIFTNLAAGDYVISVTDNNNCGPVTTEIITLTEPSSGITDSWNLSKISIYPNPADKELNIKFTDIKKSEVELEIYASTGARVLHQVIHLDNMSNTHQLNMEEMAPGLYFIVVDKKRLPSPLMIK
ncbi:MAG: T9SS type A sorting domain-containing protein, partial [Mariniphaga sp.]